MPTTSWINPLFRGYIQTLKSDATSRFAFYRAVGETLRHPILKEYSSVILLTALRERNWIVIEHELRALSNRLLQVLPEEILSPTTNKTSLEEKALVICGLRLLADQAHHFRRMPPNRQKK